MTTKTKAEILADGNTIENAVLEYVDVQLTAHFGNCASLVGTATCESGCVGPFSLYNSTKNIGFILKALFELLDLSAEDGKRLSEVRNVPCRLIFDGNGGWGSKCIGIGSLLLDKFVYRDDLMKEGCTDECQTDK